MKSIVLWLMFVISPAVWGTDLKESFLQSLSNNQKVLLNDFLLSLTQSPSGYVLYGDKPMSIEIYDLSSLRILSGMNQKTALMLKGKELWEDLNLNLDNKEYLLTSFEKDSKCHIVCINRKAFLQAVNDNLPLFRYVLGPTLKPEKLLQELVSCKDQFYQVLNHNPVLLGILLGHGTQNAILSSRYKCLSHETDRYDEFPYVSKVLNKSWVSFPEKYMKQPSLGYRSIVEEELSLEKMMARSNQLKSFESFEIPAFDCKSDTKETSDLLTSYEEVRKRILKASSNKNFLSEALARLFLNSTQTLEIPHIPQQKNLCLPASKEETITKLVGIIHRTIGNDSKKFLNAFMQGVAAREKGQKMPVPSEWKRSKDVTQIERDLECCKNLGKADAYFERLATREDLIALVPNKIYYKTLKEGTENLTSANVKKVSFQYSMQILGDKQSKDWGVIKKENPSSFIPGIAMALVGMAEGEERIVYIHPEYAYGESSFFAPNIAIVAQVRLLNFENGDHELQILPPHQLEKRDYQDLVTRFEVLRAEEFFDEGVEFWDSMKKSGDFIDFGIFQKIYHSNNDTSFQNPHQEQQFVSDLEYYLFSMQRN